MGDCHSAGRRAWRRGEGDVGGVERRRGSKWDEWAWRDDGVGEEGKRDGREEERWREGGKGGMEGRTGVVTSLY